MTKLPDYTLYYWPIQFRGQFVRAVLAHVSAKWDEVDFDEIIAVKGEAPRQQPIPFMGPPLLIDRETEASIAQLPAILNYLGEKHDLFPDDLMLRSITHKIIADANDVLYEMTRYNGAQMWTAETWGEFQPRLTRWMSMFEEIGNRHNLTVGSGYYLGTQNPSLADLVVAILWGTMTAKLTALRPMLETHAPVIAGLSDRILATPEQSDLRSRSDDLYGNGWCSGQIEASLRAVL